MATAADIPLLIVSENSSSERRISPSWSIAQLKSRLEPVTGVPATCQRLSLKIGSQAAQPIEAADEESTILAAWPLQAYAEIKVGMISIHYMLQSLVSHGDVVWSQACEAVTYSIHPCHSELVNRCTNVHHKTTSETKHISRRKPNYTRKTIHAIAAIMANRDQHHTILTTVLPTRSSTPARPAPAQTTPTRPPWKSTT